MASLVAEAKAHQRKERRRRWVEKHIVSDDPHPELDTSAGIGPWLFLTFVVLSCGVYLALGWWVYNQ